jgi:hypothetical protein
MYDALTSRYTFPCPVRGETRVQLSDFRTLARLEGRPIGLVANDPAHLGGAIDAPSADKLARFLQLCDAHGLPVVSLCDTPGFMVGPEAEKTATVRVFNRASNTVEVAGASGLPGRRRSRRWRPSAGRLSAAVTTSSW